MKLSNVIVSLIVGVSLVTSPAPSWAEGKNPKEERHRSGK